MAEKFSEKFSGPVNPACPGAALPSEYACATSYYIRNTWRPAKLREAFSEREQTMSTTTATSERVRRNRNSGAQFRRVWLPPGASVRLLFGLTRLLLHSPSSWLAAQAGSTMKTSAIPPSRRKRIPPSFAAIAVNGTEDLATSSRRAAVNVAKREHGFYSKSFKADGDETSRRSEECGEKLWR